MFSSSVFTDTFFSPAGDVGVMQPVTKSTEDVTRPKNPQNSCYFQCVQNQFEILEMHWEERYQNQYGFFRPHVREFIYRYLECGDLHLGFARVRCESCGHEYLLAFSCKSAFLPILSSEAGCRVFSIPNALAFTSCIIAGCSKLSQCAWKV